MVKSRLATNTTITVRKPEVSVATLFSNTARPSANRGEETIIAPNNYYFFTFLSVKQNGYCAIRVCPVITKYTIQFDVSMRNTRI